MDPLNTRLLTASLSLALLTQVSQAFAEERAQDGRPRQGQGQGQGQGQAQPRAVPQRSAPPSGSSSSASPGPMSPSSGGSGSGGGGGSVGGRYPEAGRSTPSNPITSPTPSSRPSSSPGSSTTYNSGSGSSAGAGAGAGTSTGTAGTGGSARDTARPGAKPATTVTESSRPTTRSTEPGKSPATGGNTTVPSGRPATPGTGTPTTAGSGAGTPGRPGNNSSPIANGTPGSNPGSLGARVESANRPVPIVRPALTTKTTADGTQVKIAPSGQVREKVETKAGGEQRTQVMTPTGRVEREVVKKPDGTQKATEYDLGHREKRAEVTNKDGSKETTNVHYNRNGEVRAQETVKTNAKGEAVSKTVTVKNNLVVNNTTVNNTTVINNNTTVINNNGGGRYGGHGDHMVTREYHRGRFGFVYAPVVIAAPIWVGWYDPYWYSPAGVVIVHPFHYNWGWESHGWYGYHRYYWEPYPVYAAPSYWVTDWMVAGYMADRYAVSVSVEQTREEVRLAREDAEKARAAAQQARDEAEIAEAKAAQAAAEARAALAEAKAQKAEAEEAKRKQLAESGQKNPNATPIDQATKDALKDQVEKTIAEKKALADQAAAGKTPVPPDLLQVLSDPKHIYPVSRNVSVILAKDSSPAGLLTAGDLIKVEPGQEAALKDAKENDFITMRVMTSKGEEGEVLAGTLISVSLKDLQEFDNEFRAKLDLGLTEADKNKELFKQQAAK